ncbi:PD40 domain-containing protein [candidate division KSB1 bacterium]|nr:PD40 domain-containing protein [candidate division KSB1 bacterium]
MARLWRFSGWMTVVVSLWTCPAFSQYLNYNHPELDWHTLDTEHFQVHYHDGAERTARVVANVAEDIYLPVTSLYEWEPDGKIHFIIRDHDDNSNGAAFYYDNKVEIWAPQMTFILRGTHNWLRNVVTHEFSHMISLGASRKLPRRIPAFYFQWINYEDEKRSDVLYGYPDRLVSYPLPMTVVPMWLAEGMAQYQTPGLDYDRWDSHRDMLIRTAVLAGKMHSYDAMGVFGKNSLGNERTYNAGYAFVRYIAQHWGPESLMQLAELMSQPTRFSVDGALKKITGYKGQELYEKWKDQLQAYYNERIVTVSQNRSAEEIFVQQGIGNTFPVWSPDGKYIAFCGSKTADYLSQSSLKFYNVETGKIKTIASGVQDYVSWSADGQKLYFSKQRKYKHLSYYNDIHIYDLNTKKTKRLTKGLRAVSPNVSPDGEKIVAITQMDGTDNLLLLQSDGTNPKKLTDYENGEAVFSPSWSPDGRLVVFSKARHHGRDIFLFHVESGEITPLIENLDDARDPVFTPDGKQVCFAWDKTGIFDIFTINIDGSGLQQWTNVTGGAFMPSVNHNGEIVFSSFLYDGYKIAVLKNPEPVEPSNARYAELNIAHDLPEFKNNQVVEELNPIRNYDDTQRPDVASTPYGMTYGQLSFLPRVMVDSSRIKLGTYFYASDILDRYSVLGGVAMNARKEMDIFAIFEYRRLSPTLFVELYGLTRKINRKIEVIEGYHEKADVDIHFNILEADAGAEFYPEKGQKIRFSYSHQRYTSQIMDFQFRNQIWASPANTYFIGNHFKIDMSGDNITPAVFSQINPSSGFKWQFLYTLEYNQFFKDFATNNDYGTLQEVYTPYNYNRFQIFASLYLPVFKKANHSLTIAGQTGYMDLATDSFFHFFAGGMPGLYGYPYYSIGGRQYTVSRLTYRLPIFRGLQRRVFNVTTDKLYFAFTLGRGNALVEQKRFAPLDLVKNMKSDIGFNLRFSAFSFYGFPTALSLTAAYGINKFKNEESTYGGEWRYYLTLLFDFIE